MGHKRWLVLLLVLIITAIAISGCRQTPDTTPPEPQQQEENQENQTDAIREEWADSAHATVTNADSSNSPAKRDGCIICHDGRAYNKQISSADELDTGEPVGADCETCHTGHGKEVWQSGLVQLPAGEVRDGGGALCMDCHNARSIPDPADRPAPHASAEADIVMGINGFHVEGKTYGSSPHTAVKDTCFGCHMADLGKGYPSHTFRSELETCEQCHKGIDSINMKAKDDYDGDGTVEGFQDEVDGLLKMLHDTIQARLEGGTFTSTHGRIAFMDEKEEEMEEVPAELYHGAWNYYLVANDGSRGIHNPLYVVQLLQQSILMLGGDLGEAKQL
ncbi:MAG: ammonia-forming cytochrome c nitrite reductase subunit c552 [Clostridia bacterium]|nr:ammonia-forming cytochrome c nitrite reductase subunit c552 [Clostridia bacterium]